MADYTVPSNHCQLKPVPAFETGTIRLFGAIHLQFMMQPLRPGRSRSWKIDRSGNTLCADANLLRARLLLLERLGPRARARRASLRAPRVPLLTKMRFRVLRCPVP